MIYAMAEMGDMSVVKIGFTHSRFSAHRDTLHRAISNRMSGLQIGNWRKLVCVAALEGGKNDERLWHAQFSHYHVAGEWFLNHREVADWIAQNSVGEPIALSAGRGKRRTKRARPRHGCQWPKICGCASCVIRRSAIEIVRGRAA